MTDSHMKIVCSRSLMITNLKPDENFQTDTLKVGAYKDKVYTSYIYFDLRNFPTNYQVNYALLKMYLKDHISHSSRNGLYVHPLKEDFGGFTTFNNQPEYGKEHMEPTINNYGRGWVDVNVTSMVNSWNKNSMDNKGLVLLGYKGKNSPLVFYSPLAVNYEFMPIIDISYKCVHDLSDKKIIDVIEKHWTKSFHQSGISPIVNVERIIQGTFFIDNVGESPIEAIIEISSDSVKWVNDSYKTIEKGETKSLVPERYGKYYRLLLTSLNKGIAEIRFVYQVYR